MTHQNLKMECRRTAGYGVCRQAVFWILHCSFAFYALIFNLRVSAPAETRPPIIGRTCTIRAKIYKNVGGILGVNDWC